jgi:hypothetical protein
MDGLRAERGARSSSSESPDVFASLKRIETFGVNNEQAPPSLLPLTMGNQLPAQFPPERWYITVIPPHRQLSMPA